VFFHMLQAARTQGWEVCFDIDGFSVSVPREDGPHTVFHGVPAGRYAAPSFVVMLSQIPKDLHQHVLPLLEEADFIGQDGETFHITATRARTSGARLLLALAHAVSNHPPA
jgi:hypothetical protein